ncbi:cell filamentation protein FIC [Mycobacterium tuberculosis]|nr:cell filamentation protein FIC [Mycobacterium tuberculosis]
MFVQATELQKVKRRFRNVRATRRNTELEGTRSTAATRADQNDYARGKITAAELGERVPAGTTSSNRGGVPHPWDTGDHERNWQGYFIPAMSVLRNRVGARTHAELRDAENDLVEARVIELREDPNLLGDRTDLAYLRAIHRQLFQDIYVWAGDLRTVGIEKEDESFCAPGGISRPMEHVAAEIYQLDRLRAVGEGDLAGQVAYRYDYVNYAHPFREGNGRSTREFFDLLLSERGLDWGKTDLEELHGACHVARANSDLTGLVAMFKGILDAEPTYDF